MSGLASTFKVIMWTTTMAKAPVENNGNIFPWT